MNEEIKEILTNCEKAINEASGYNDTTDKILDYITNLQQRSVDIGEYNTLVNKYNEIYKENERLKEEKQRLLYNLEKVCEENATTNN